MRSMVLAGGLIVMLAGCTAAYLKKTSAGGPAASGAVVTPVPTPASSSPTLAPTPQATGPAGSSATSPTLAQAPVRPAGPIPPPRRDVPGKRFEVQPKRELFVPDYFQPDQGRTIPVVVHFLGAAWCVEQCFYDARLNAVLISVNPQGEGDFAQMGIRLEGILAQSSAKLAVEGISTKPFGPICISSFSGGFEAVRTILRQPGWRDRISDVVLADSLYGPYVPGRSDQLQPESLEPFLEYARLASRGKATFLFSHLYPPEARYRNNKTTLAANYLIQELGADREDAAGTNSRGAKLLYRADLGGFHVFGYAGMTTQDHFEHLYSIADLLKLTSLPKAE